jgi:hypothetical protein
MTSPKLAALRGQIARLQSDIHQVAAAGRPVAVTLPHVAEQLDHLAEPYRKGIARAAVEVLAARGSVSLHSAFNLSYAAPEFAVGAIAALLRDRILADLEKEIESIADRMPPSMTDEQQRAEGRRLRNELRALEREEEALIVAEEARGNHIERRPDADPAAVLGIPDGILEELGL